MALTCVKAYWAEMDATTAAQGSAIGRVGAEHYFEVLEGARLIEAQCSKNIMFE